MEFWVILYGGTIGCCCITSVWGKNKKKRKRLVCSQTATRSSLIQLYAICCNTFLTFLPEDARVPGQHGLQQHWSVSLWLIATQVVLQLSAHTHAKHRFSHIRNFRSIRLKVPFRAYISEGYISDLLNHISILNMFTSSWFWHDSNSSIWDVCMMSLAIITLPVKLCWKFHHIVQSDEGQTPALTSTDKWINLVLTPHLSKKNKKN